ncbi:endonuclease MutS2 [Acetonema longum]|uniref:Endonuclease MutS2 n=1 Tax=Acetonema longum DSM 6540 TaxID=1009370 RepID=F7NNE9_9FIRM|nr:endonuclease MutS2 [Acetonema longum]EGO62390.1 MutS2 family protein [Acetonema longum DSM 6540]
MDSLVLSVLEYPKVLQLLISRTSSALGRELAEALLPATEMEEVQFRLSETREALGILCSVPNVPLGGIRDIREGIKRAAIGGILDTGELMAVGGVLYAIRRMKSFFQDIPDLGPILTDYSGGITPVRNLEQAIENAISEQGQIRDDASPELSRLRREIRTTRQRIREKVDSILHSSEYQKYFQDVLVTVRGDRYCIPVKQEHRHQFPGIIHDQSASGATVFIEPMAVVQLNNDLKQAMAAEKNEIERILTLLSLQVAKSASLLTQSCETMAHIDFAFAKARLALDLKAHEPLFNQTGQVELRQARHPLIPSEDVVPIDVRIGNDFHILVITGPNTGGKTVALKTVGIFALMAQAGLFIPAANECQLTVFHNIFADIGDEQSIEQSLSTFSAHMTNLVRILNQVTGKDLVLLDEIGIGTDPDEGAALAMAILEYLHSIGARTIATTHYSELKTFAYSRSGIENACVEFDQQTLRPTYRLLIGVPGSSNAFQISKRLGLPVKIIDRARQLLDKGHVEMESVLSSLEEEKTSYIRRNAAIEQQERQITELRKKLELEQETLTEKKAETINKAKNEAAGILRQARRDAEEVIKELKEQFQVKDGQERQYAIHAARKRLRDNLSQAHHLEDQRESLPTVSAEDLRPGMKVWVVTLRQNGTVISVDSGEATVQLGIMKVNVALKDCRLAEGADEPRERAPQSKKTVDTLKTQTVSRQIDIRGITVEEAELQLDKYLDDAVLSGLSEALVIHGKGTGALRKGVRSYLKQHRHVRSIEIAGFNEGGDGATLVKL